MTNAVLVSKRSGAPVGHPVRDVERGGRPVRSNDGHDALSHATMSAAASLQLPSKAIALGEPILCWLWPSKLRLRGCQRIGNRHESQQLLPLLPREASEEQPQTRRNPSPRPRKSPTQAPNPNKSTPTRPRAGPEDRLLPPHGVCGTILPYPAYLELYLVPHVR